MEDILDKIAVDSCEEDVILIQSSSQQKTKQPPSRKNHFFTYNNYDDDEIDVIVCRLKEMAWRGKIQSEIGSNGTPHLQGMIWCSKPHRSTEFKLPKQIHWEPLKDKDNKRDYCGKDETHDGKFRTSWGFPKPLKILDEDDFFQWQIQINNYIKSEPDDREILWVWSHEGCCGKSTFVKYLIYTYNAVFASKGQYSDIMNILYNANMDNTNLVIFDLPRMNGNNISYSALESIKNGMICNTKYETGSKLFNPPHILVFANEAPDRTAMSADRFKELEIFAQAMDNGDTLIHNDMRTFAA